MQDQPDLSDYDPERDGPVLELPVSNVVKGALVARVDFVLGDVIKALGMPMPAHRDEDPNGVSRLLDTSISVIQLSNGLIGIGFCPGDRHLGPEIAFEEAIGRFTPFFGFMHTQRTHEFMKAKVAKQGE